jgi:hypothetical protein
MTALAREKKAVAKADDCLALLERACRARASGYDALDLALALEIRATLLAQQPALGRRVADASDAARTAAEALATARRARGGLGTRLTELQQREAQATRDLDSDDETR